MVGRVAEAEAALALAAAQAGVADGVPALATSLAEAIEADRVAAAAAEGMQTVVARAETITGSFARVSRSIRLTVLLAERIERGWARLGAADDRQAMARRQIVRGVADAIGCQAEGERADRLGEALAERMEQLDAEDGILERPAEEIIRAICRDLGLDPARMTVASPVAQARRRTAGPGWEARPARRRPDG